MEENYKCEEYQIDWVKADTHIRERRLVCRPINRINLFSETPMYSDNIICKRVAIIRIFIF